MKIITGMHRSGTSLVARFVFEAGGDLGDPKTFYHPDKWNTDGYYEQIEILRINRKLIHGRWGKAAYFFLPKEKTILKRGEKYRRDLNNLYLKYKDKFVKDPRFCLTLPAWIENGAVFEKIVIVVREPIQVAYSLKKRNRISVRLGLKLWYEHNKRLLNYIKEIPHIFVFYNKLLNQETSFQEIKKMFSFFNINKTDDEIKNLITKIVKPSMNHNDINLNNYPYEIKLLWEEINKKDMK